MLGLGCAPSICTDSTNDSVGGNISANQALAVIVHGVTIGGSVVVTGGGGGVTCAPPPLFDTDPQLAGTPAYGDFENNVIKGNLTVTGLQSCWFGALRDQIGGSFIYNDNTFADPDASENLNSTIAGNLICVEQRARCPVWRRRSAAGDAAQRCSRCSTRGVRLLRNLSEALTPPAAGWPAALGTHMGIGAWLRSIDARHENCIMPHEEPGTSGLHRRMRTKQGSSLTARSFRGLCQGCLCRRYSRPPALLRPAGLLLS